MPEGRTLLNRKSRHDYISRSTCCRKAEHCSIERFDVITWASCLAAGRQNTAQSKDSTWLLQPVGLLPEGRTLLSGKIRRDYMNRSVCFRKEEYSVERFDVITRASWLAAGRHNTAQSKGSTWFHEPVGLLPEGRTLLNRKVRRDYVSQLACCRKAEHCSIERVDMITWDGRLAAGRQNKAQSKGSKWLHHTSVI